MDWNASRDIFDDEVWAPVRDPYLHQQGDLYDCLTRGERRKYV